MLRRAAIAALAGVATLASPAARAASTNFATVERGKYLTALADCASCHTNPGGRPFAGGRPIQTPFGNVVAPNITPDLETGIGAWSDADFKSALKRGRGRAGTYLYPAMPYSYYTKMSDDDVLAIRSYLQTKAPVKNNVVSDQLPFPFNIRQSMRVWNALYFKTGDFKPSPDKSADWNRGAYLVQGPGHCAACHTPKTFMGGDRQSASLQGYASQGWFAPNITDDPANGIGRWSVQEIVAYLQRATTALRPPPDPWPRRSQTRVRICPIRTSWRSQRTSKAYPAIQRRRTAVSANDPVMKAGASIYRDTCSACHAINGEGSPDLFPSLAGSPSVRSVDATSLIHMVLRGGRSVATAQEPTAPAMPSYAWQLDDAQVAAVLTYIRNSWGASAAAVSADDVRKQRQALDRGSD